MKELGRRVSRYLVRGMTTVVLVILAMLAIGIAPASASPVPTKSANAGAQGGSITVVELSGFYGSWTGFDPPVATSASTFEPSVLGSLFDVGPHFSLIPDLATSYQLSDGGLMLTIDLRHGVQFSNGDPFDASVVAFNMQRDIEPSLPNGATTAMGWPMSSITTPNNYTVVVHFSKVFAPVASELNQTALGLTVDPVALQKMGEAAYNIDPIGAGPYEVVSDKPGSNLVVQRNPTFWKKGYPKLDSIHVETVGSEESGVEALQAGQAQVMEQLRTLNLVQQLKQSKQLNLYATAGETPFIIQLNTTKPPFNNVKAREAIYYATDSAAIDKSLFGDAYPLTESPTGPGGLFYEPKVPGYPPYDLAKAKALVKELGGLQVQLGDTNLLTNNETMEALQSEWSQAGIQTSLSEYILPALINQYRSGNWQALLQIAGGYDPALGVGTAFRLESTSVFSGVHDPTLDAMLTQAAGELTAARRTADYHAIFKYVSDHAYMPSMFNGGTYDLSTKNMIGANPPAGTGGDGYSDINWMNVRLK